MKTLVAVGLLLSACFIFSAFAGDSTTIDTLNVNLAPLSLSAVGSSCSSASGAGILGGQRNMFLNLLSINSANVAASSSISEKQWSFRVPVGASAEAHLIWDGPGDNSGADCGSVWPEGLPCQDLTDDFGYAFKLRAFADAAVVYHIRVWSGHDNWSDATINVPAGGLYVDYFAKFSDFSGNATFTCVRAIDLWISSSTPCAAFVSSVSVVNSEVCGQVFRDCNRNGVLDVGEFPFEAINVTIKSGSTIVSSILSDSNGQFSLYVFASGSYQVCALAPGQATSPAGGCSTINIALGADQCGLNFGFFVSTFVSAPEDVILDCVNDNVNPSATGIAHVDACAQYVLNYTDVTVQAACPLIIRRTWTATTLVDSDSDVQTITVRDVTNPFFTAFPSNVNLTCGSNVAPSILGFAVAQDACSLATVTYADISSGDNCLRTIIRVWTAHDACGNSFSRNQTIMLFDNAAPVFNFFPADVYNLDCDDGIAVATTGTPSAADACGVAHITFHDNETSNACTILTARTWVASDDCGNKIEKVQRITKNDLSRPFFREEDFPADVTVNCGAPTTVAALGTAVADDFCSPNSVVVTYTDSYENEGSCFGHIHRKWTATDGCGNAVSRIQQIFIRDIYAPVFSFFPAAAVVDCVAEYGPAQVGQPTASDNCTAVASISYDDSISGDLCAGRLVLRTWTAIDICGNFISQVQNITIVDRTAPEFVQFPGDLHVECNEDFSPENLGRPLAVDDCSGVVLPLGYVDSAPANSSLCSQTIQRQWTAVDACGNMNRDTQLITIRDSTKPYFNTFPADVIVSCEDSIEPSFLGVPTGFDNCDESPLISHVDSNTDLSLCPNGFRINRVWTITDSCGNSVSRTQVITQELNKAPVLSVPADITIDCGQSSAPANTGSASANASCDATPSITFSDEDSGQSCPKVIIRTWMVTDACNNMAAGIQRILITDLLPPNMQLPANITINCEQDASDLSLTGRPTASDNCDTDVQFSFSDTVSNGPDQPGLCLPDLLIHRLWVARDNCGNRASGVQLIRVVKVREEGCIPQPCNPVPCNPSSCPPPPDCTCPGPANCLPSDCLPQNCAPQLCAAEFCDVCETVQVCTPDICDTPTYVYIHDDDDSTN